MSHTSRQGSRQSKGTSAGSETSRSPRRSPNKIYRTPPTPPPEQLYRLERSFTLDCIAVDTTSKDYAKVNPKLGQVTRPYNGQKDRSARDYFRFQGVDRTITRNGQATPRRGTSIEGPVVDRFYEGGAGFQYISRRNIAGAGSNGQTVLARVLKISPIGSEIKGQAHLLESSHSRETIDGHSRFMTDLKPIYGYNGYFGYRRNTPWLRREPSTFGTATNSPIY